MKFICHFGIRQSNSSRVRSYFFGSAGLSPPNVALMASRSWSPRWAPPTNRGEMFPSRPMTTVWGMACRWYFSAMGTWSLSRTTRESSMPFQHGLDLLRSFLKVDGDEDHVLLGELGDGLDLRHGLDARPAPRRPEVEDNDLAFIVGQAELFPFH